MTILDTTALDRAISQCQQALDLHSSALSRSDLVLALHLRAAAIQAFEFTYELSIKFLRRFYEENTLAVDQQVIHNFNAFIRMGYEAGLLNAELSVWKTFRERRGITSHTYDEDKAQMVFIAIPEFLTEAIFLRDQILLRQKT